MASTACTASIRCAWPHHTYDQRLTVRVGCHRRFAPTQRHQRPHTLSTRRHTPPHHATTCRHSARPPTGPGLLGQHNQHQDRHTSRRYTWCGTRGGGRRVTRRHHVLTPARRAKVSETWEGGGRVVVFCATQCVVDVSAVCRAAGRG
jgi:hypothetical protein